MVFQETDIGEGIYAADENNEANSERGAHVRSGGEVTVGASSQDIALNIDACKIRIQGNDWTIASGTPAVALVDNATAYPRRDLVFAKKGPTPSDPGSFEVTTGDPIDNETMQTLVAEGVINQDGTPIAKPEDIPEIQPPAFKGHRDDATLLAMVYVPPGASDSAAIAGDYITDLRMEGIGVNDVLRTGDAIRNIESSPGVLDATVTNSELFAGEVPDFYARNTFTLVQRMPPNQARNQFIDVPPGYDFGVRRAGTADENNQSPPGLYIVVRDVTGATLTRYEHTTETAVDTFSGNQGYRIQFVNTTNVRATGILMCEFVRK